MLDKTDRNIPFDSPEQPEKLIKVDINEVKDTFITNFILIYFNEVKKKHPTSLKLQTICNHYSMFIAKKPQLCISQLRHFSDKGLSFLD